MKQHDDDDDDARRFAEADARATAEMAARHLTPIEIAVWAAEFVRVRSDAIIPTRTSDQIDYAINNAVKSANTALVDLRKAYR